MNQQITGSLSLGRDLTLRVYPTGGRALVTVDKPHLILGYILSSAPYIKWINDPAMSGKIVASDYERIMGGLGADGLLSNLAEYLAVEAFRAPTQHQIYGPFDPAPYMRPLSTIFNDSGITLGGVTMTLTDANGVPYVFTDCFGFETGPIQRDSDETIAEQLQGITNYLATYQVRNYDTGAILAEFPNFNVPFAVSYQDGNYVVPVNQPHLKGWNYGGIFSPMWGTYNGVVYRFNTGVNWPNHTEYNYSWDRMEYLYNPGNPQVATTITGLVCLVQE